MSNSNSIEIRLEKDKETKCGYVTFVGGNPEEAYTTAKELQGILALKMPKDVIVAISIYEGHPRIQIPRLYLGIANNCLENYKNLCKGVAK